MNKINVLAIIIMVLMFITLLLMLAGLLYSQFTANADKKNDISAEMVVSEVIERYTKVVLVGNVPVTKHYVKVAYKDLTLIIDSVSLYDSVDIGSEVDVYLVKNKKKSDRLELSY